ncbi:hypothetical protein SDC9_172387 [bioreactor metagenome]|uniref:Uncharacterized protein n=1 Tax=bioreactor metagenome TaxID=1076179 RepID=A0A645GFU1_9ZZZZ
MRRQQRQREPAADGGVNCLHLFVGRVVWIHGRVVQNTLQQQLSQQIGQGGITVKIADAGLAALKDIGTERAAAGIGKGDQGLGAEGESGGEPKLHIRSLGHAHRGRVVRAAHEDGDAGLHGDAVLAQLADAQQAASAAVQSHEPADLAVFRNAVGFKFRHDYHSLSSPERSSDSSFAQQKQVSPLPFSA